MFFVLYFEELHNLHDYNIEELHNSRTNDIEETHNTSNTNIEELHKTRHILIEEIHKACCITANIVGKIPLVAELPKRRKINCQNAEKILA